VPARAREKQGQEAAAPAWGFRLRAPRRRRRTEGRSSSPTLAGEVIIPAGYDAVKRRSMKTRPFRRRSGLTLPPRDFPALCIAPISPKNPSILPLYRSSSLPGKLYRGDSSRARARSAFLPNYRVFRGDSAIRHSRSLNSRVFSPTTYIFIGDSETETNRIDEDGFRSARYLRHQRG